MHYPFSSAFAHSPMANATFSSKGDNWSVDIPTGWTQSFWNVFKMDLRHFTQESVQSSSPARLNKYTSYQALGYSTFEKKVLHYNRIFSTAGSANFPFIRPINISHTGFQTAPACQFSLQATLQAALMNTTGLPCVWASFSCGSSCQAEFIITRIRDSHAGSRKPLVKTVLLLSTRAVCGSFAVSQRAAAKKKQFPALALSSK